MARFPHRFHWLTLALLAAAPAGVAQRDPHLGYVYPAGGQVGTTVEVTVGGQYLGSTTNAYVSGAGVQAVVPAYEPLITGKQAKAFRERLQELRNLPKTKSPEVLKEIMELRQKLMAFDKKRQTPALADTIVVQITIAPDAAVGNRELRVATFTGLSNPLVFQVGQRPEFREPTPVADTELPMGKDPKTPRRSRSNAGTTNGPLLATTITLPATLNGQILPGEVDRFRFKARQGQQLVIVSSARELIPYLADAVPGWFQAKLVLLDSQGKELIYDDHYRFHPDPVLFYTVPQAGEYLLEIKDSLYRGREDFVYRIAIDELPFITSVFPLGAQAGTQTKLTLGGWNLPVTKATVNLQGVEPGVYPYTVRNKEQLSNPAPFFVDTLPECLKKSPSNSLTNAQRVTLPIVINGHIDRPGDVDVFRFDGQVGEQVVAEVQARHLDSPLDSVLKLTDAAGKQLAFNDDHEDKGSGLNTHHADSYLTATLPATGTYYLHLWDAQQKGGWDYSYRVRLSAPRPDFELRAVPSSLSARPGGSVPVTVFALRRDGFTNEIAVTLKDAPAGFKLSHGSLIGTQEQVKLSLTVPPKPAPVPLSLTLEGRATIQGREVVHPAVPADDLMQAFIYRHLVTAKELRVAVLAPPPKPPEQTAAAMEPLSPLVKIPAGGSARVQVKLATTDYSGKLQLDLDEPPDGITLREFTPTRAGAELVLQADASKIKPGQKGQLLVKAFSFSKSPAPGRRVPLGVVPGIPFEIVPP